MKSSTIQQNPASDLTSFRNFFSSSGKIKNPLSSTFWNMVRKEISDHVRSWRFIILLIIISLTCLGSLYVSLSGFAEVVKKSASNDEFFFLKLFTQSDGTLPSFFVFVSFLGPLLGISIGFDAINSEQNRGTLSRILAQPVPRDYVLNSKFIAGTVVIAIMFFSLSFLVIGTGLLALGIPPTPEEFLRIMVYTLISVIYVSFWLNLSILFSVRFKQAATSALSGIAVWLFFTVFYPLLMNLVLKGIQPSRYALPRTIFRYETLKYGLTQIMPNELFSEITSTLLVPSVRSLGPLTQGQIQGAIPGPLPLGQSLMVVWPQLTGLIALTLICFLISYYMFMRREIRSR
ncbi:ABC transporter permease [Saccharicrinis sp. FJH2]|uniref:ABC transporter permease n=1 Tax=Saccharicrinis sp. FJH65 TaxID=3344659 RepID=UPI0035F44F29